MNSTTRPNLYDTLYHTVHYINNFNKHILIYIYVILHGTVPEHVSKEKIQREGERDGIWTALRRLVMMVTLLL